MKKYIHLSLILSTFLLVSCNKEDTKTPAVETSADNVITSKDTSTVNELPLWTEEVQYLELENFSIPIRNDFTIKDWIAYSWDYQEWNLWIIKSGTSIALWFWSPLGESLRDNKNAAEFFYSNSLSCSNCNQDNFAEIIEVNGISFALDKTLFTKDTAWMWINDNDIENEVFLYSASTWIDRREITVSMNVPVDSDSEEIEKLFKDTLMMFR